MWLWTHFIDFKNPMKAWNLKLGLTGRKKINSSWKEKKALLLSHVRLFATLWTVACQGPLSLEFSGQEYWSGLPFPSSRDLPNPGIEPRSPALQADSLPTETPKVKTCINLNRKLGFEKYNILSRSRLTNLGKQVVDQTKVFSKCICSNFILDFMLKITLGLT